MTLVRLGRTPSRPRRPDLRRPPRPHRDHTARDQPRAGARGGRARAPDPQRVRASRRGHARRAQPRDGQPEHADRRSRAPGRHARARQPLDAASVPARRGERRRDASPALPLARPAPRKLQRNITLRAQMVGIIRREMEEAGFLDIQTPILFKPTPEGARDFVVPSRLQQGRFYALPQSPQILKQLTMVAGLRPLLPDRDLLPGRGSPRRPRPGDHAARRRDELPRPGVPVRRDGADVRAHLARVPRDRDRDAVPPHDVRGGRPPLRHRQARHCASGSSSRTRRRSLATPSSASSRAPRPSASSACRRSSARRPGEARGAREGVGREGARLPRLRRGGRGALADREVSLRGGARGLPRRPGDDRPLRRRPVGRRHRACSVRSGSISAASSD